MVLYNDAAVLYDSPTITYDGDVFVVPLFRLRNVTKGYDFEITKGSFSLVDARPCELAKFGGTLEDTDGDIELDDEDEIEVYHAPDGTPVIIFGGDVTARVQTDRSGGTGPRVHKFTAQDFTARLSDNVITQARDVTESVEDRVAWLATWSDRGLTFDSVEAITDEIGPFDYTGMTVDQGLAQVAQIANAMCYADDTKDVHFFQSEVVSAPYELVRPADPPDSYPYRDFAIEGATRILAHAVFVKYEGGAVWREAVGAPVGATRQERSISVRSDSLADAEAAGDAFLAKWSEESQSGELSVRQPGLKGGMTARIANPAWGIDESFLITSVAMSLPGPRTAPLYRVRFARHYVCGPKSAQLSVAVVSVPVQVKNEVNQHFVDLSIAGANQVPNSSFESTSDWTSGALWSMGFASALPYYGPKTSKVAPSGSASGELVTTAFINVDRTKDWWLSFWSRLSAYTAGIARCVLREYDSGGSLLQSTNIDLQAVEADWMRHSEHFGPSAKEDRTAFHASTVKVKIAFYATTTPTFTWEIDAVQLEQSEVLTAYAPAPNEIADSAITTTKIADDAVTTPKLVALAITAAKIAAGAITTAKLAADAVIAYVLNVGGTVQIDDDGIYVTDGAIVVENSGTTVIIDGESNMLKIAASGSVNNTAGANSVTNTQATLSGIGAVSVTPAAVFFFGDTSSNVGDLTFSHDMENRQSVFVAGSSGGSPTIRVMGVKTLADGYIGLDGSNVPFVNMTISNYDTASATKYMFYFVFIESPF